MGLGSRSIASEPGPIELFLTTACCGMLYRVKRGMVCCFDVWNRVRE